MDKPGRGFEKEPIDEKDPSIDTEALLYVLEEVPGRLAPYVPTPHWLLDTISEILKDIMRDTRLDIVYEPGCGAGEAAAKIEESVHPRHYICLEIDASLAKIARTKLTTGDVVVADLRNPPLRPHPLLIYSYLLPRPLEYVIQKAEKGSVIVSLEYRAEHAEVKKEIVYRIETPLTTHHVIVYMV
ncbi:hypothetical protein Pyrfu_1479 [Pyrolobus fumarii 1A]|uniref:Uncharacterized protein n=1 Tax=Pyrolobus fumarii (strain DSM 11204 / 1A) TaxID=694429 RepID=G0EHB3_PYRF1|nr:class I SAM-dependent methyltransferase [Pyrolobus fumarii]AEM39337.1 hypothetical protein Pyrfu_1479 [Pyrolobus fumarii 1A]